MRITGVNVDEFQPGRSLNLQTGSKGMIRSSVNDPRAPLGPRICPHEEAEPRRFAPYPSKMAI